MQMLNVQIVRNPYFLHILCSHAPAVFAISVAFGLVLPCGCPLLNLISRSLQLFCSRFLLPLAPCFNLFQIAPVFLPFCCFSSSGSFSLFLLHLLLPCPLSPHSFLSSVFFAFLSLALSWSRSPAYRPISTSLCVNVFCLADASLLVNAFFPAANSCYAAFFSCLILITSSFCRCHGER